MAGGLCDTDVGIEKADRWNRVGTPGTDLSTKQSCYTTQIEPSISGGNVGGLVYGAGKAGPPQGKKLNCISISHHKQKSITDSSITKVKL